jgi:hypothetical protein
MTKVAELYGMATFQPNDWAAVAKAQQCPFLDRKCLKNRKSAAELTLGTCTMRYGSESTPVIICPQRLLENRQIFMDCVHLLRMHEPGNEIRVIPELSVPGGSIDYCLVSVLDGKPKDFVGIELQTLDSTGTVWPERQRFLHEHGVKVAVRDAKSAKSFGMNWKMTAKTILMQLHHKIATFEHVNRHLVLVLQDCLLEYMRGAFNFGHLSGVRAGDPLHIHPYQLKETLEGFRLSLKTKERVSTDGDGLSACLGLQREAKIELDAIYSQLEAKLSQSTLLMIGKANQPIPVSQPVVEKSDEG